MNKTVRTVYTNMQKSLCNCRDGYIPSMIHTFLLLVNYLRTSSVFSECLFVEVKIGTTLIGKNLIQAQQTDRHIYSN